MPPINIKSNSYKLYLFRVFRNPVLLSVFTSIIFFGFYAILRDPILSKDSYTYARWADILIKHSFNYKAFFNDVSFVVPPYLYSGFVTVVALTKKILGENWQQGVVTVNAIAYISVSALISHLVFTTTKNSKAAIFSSSLFILCVECFIWVRYVLSDATFLFIIVFSTYLLFLLSEKKGSKKLWFTGIFTILFIATYRPTSLPLLIVIMLSYSLFQLNISSQIYRSSIAKYSLSFFVISVSISIFLMAYIMQDISRWPIDFARDYLNIISELYKQGNIVDDRPETFVANPETYFDYIKVIFNRFYYFFAFSIDAYSPRHSLLNYFIFIPSYVFGIIGAFYILSSKSNISEQTWKLGMISLLIVCFTFVFVSFLLIDYDWRYRLVIMPYIFILAGVGISKVLSSDEIN